MLWIFSLIAALVAPHDIETRGRMPPLSYELTLSVAYADATVLMNGMPVLEIRADAKQTHKLLLNAFLKPAGNVVDITLKPAFPGHEASGAVTVRSYGAGAGPDSIKTELDRQLTPPVQRVFDFDAPTTPALAVWTADPKAKLDDAAKDEIAGVAAAFQRDVIAALKAENATRLVALFSSYSGNRDAARFLTEEAASMSAAAMVDDLAPIVTDAQARGIVFAPVPAAADLAFRQIDRFVVVSRKDGAAVLGFMFHGDDGPGGVTIDRPVFGRVDGRWALLQDLPLPR
ncbi:MAG: hypothetical protein IT548_11330 [Alphaproteobacteria bacterium]|nr:hypothetical protein [Alphaproteobacteria bacterium]